jgi:WD40 repeat protein
MFLRGKYLYWLEALSLCRSISEGILSMAKFEDVIQVILILSRPVGIYFMLILLQGRADACTLVELARDARRFITYHGQAIQNSPLQAYASALVFSPSRSLIKGLFRKEEPQWITVKPAIEDGWSACLQILEVNSSVNSVAFSHDSTRLVSASMDYTVKIWDTGSGKCIRTLMGHSNSVNSVAFSHDSTWLVSASKDNTVKIWDTGSGKCLQTLMGHSNSVNSVAFSHDSTRLVSASKDNTVKIWDTGSGKCLQTLMDHSNLVNSVAFSHDSTRLVSASWDSTIKIWDTGSGKCLRTLESHSGSVNSVAFSHDSTRLVSVSWDGTIKIWDTGSGNCLRTLEDHGNLVISVAFSHDSTWLVSASMGGTIKILDTGSGKCLRTLESHNGPVNSVAFSHDSTWLVSASMGGTIKIWDTGSGEHPQKVNISAEPFNILPDASSSYLHTEIDTIGVGRLPDLNKTPSVTDPESLRYQGWALSADRAWITYNSENLVWLPSEYRPSISSTQRNKVSIGFRSGKVWIYNFKAKKAQC